jgi:hypothetical protein
MVFSAQAWLGGRIPIRAVASARPHESTSQSIPQLGSWSYRFLPATRLAADSTTVEESVVHGNVIGQQTIYQTIAASSTPQPDRNRVRMLHKVRDFWVKGVLENSLYGAALIALGFQYQPDAVSRPWDVIIQPTDRPQQLLPPGTTIRQVFDEFGGELLILGRPGSGKTTMLLELARDLIARAEHDPRLPIPVSSGFCSASSAAGISSSTGCSWSMLQTRPQSRN